MVTTPSLISPPVFSDSLQRMHFFPSMGFRYR